MFRPTLILLCALLLPLDVYAQGTAVVGIGDRVRVRDAQGEEVIGIVDSVAGDSLVVFDQDTSRYAFHSPSIASLEVNTGQHYEVLRTTGIVALASFGATTLLYASSGIGTGWALVTGLAGAVYSLPLGLLIGLLNERDTWTPVVPTEAARVPGFQFGPSPDGGISIAGRIGPGDRW